MVSRMMTRRGRLFFVLAACLAVLLISSLCYGQGLTNVSDRVTVTTANERSTLDRRTQMMTSTADVTIRNSSSQAISAPFHAVIDIVDNNGPVSMPDASGGPTASPYNEYYYVLAAGALADGLLAPGESAVFQVRFVRSSTVRFRYNVISYGTITAANQPPVLNPIGPRSANEGSPIQIQVSASDPDGNPLNYSASGLPNGAAFDPATRTFSWTPDYTQSGVYPVTFTVSDGTLTDSETVQITVANVNRPPVLDAIGPQVNE